MISIPGVPSLAVAVDFGPVSLALTDNLAGLGSPFTQWGIYKNGAPVIVFDTVLNFDFKRDWSLATHPIEGGGFADYNKVAIPYSAHIKFAAGGSRENRAALIQSVANIAGSLELYEVVTPEVVYPRVNVQHYDYSRAAGNGVGMIVIDVWLLEVRITSSSGGSSSASDNAPPGSAAVPTSSSPTGGNSNVQAPSGAYPVNGGTVEAPTVTSLPSGTL